MRRLLLAGLIPLFLAPAMAAQVRSRLDRGDDAWLFAYRARPGQDSVFAAGYKRHLNWHAAKGDTLAWLAWTVADGPNTGQFVDGTFGITTEMFEHRVDQRGDLEDASRNVTAYAIPAWRARLRLRRDLSGPAVLESGRVAPAHWVVQATLRPDGMATFETAVRGQGWSVYERVGAAGAPQFMIVVELKAADRGSEIVERVRQAIGGVAIELRAERWIAIPELMYFPP